MHPSTRCSDGAQASGFRDWYEGLAHAEVFVHEQDVLGLFTALAPLSGPGGLTATADAVAGWKAVREQAWACAWALLPPGAARERFVTTLALQSAPLGSVLGCWLQGLSAPGVGESRGHLALLSLLADDLGVGRPHGARRDEFRRLLQRLHLPVHGTDLAELARCRDIRDAMYAWPAALLAMSRRSDVCHVRICAADWVLRSAGILPGWALLMQHEPQWINWHRLDLSVAGNPHVVADPLVRSGELAASCKAIGDAACGAFDAAAAWAFTALDAWDRQLLACCVAAADNRQEMARLLARKSREASVYHKDTLLGGCPMSTHFQRAQTDPGPLLDLLAQSRYVKPGDAGRSLLVNGLVGPRGPMFGIFPQQELRLLREWIEGLGTAPRTDALGTVAELGGPPLAHCPPVPGAWEQGPDLKPASLHLREAYFLLQGRALAPDIRAWAVQFARRRLDAAADRAPARPERALPAAWRPAGLRSWLLDQHDLHGRDFEQSGTAPVQVSRDEAIDSTLQLAPLILIDGAWLQGFTDIELAGGAIGGPLFETYWDELGNGQVELNHPHIYRELLVSMGVRLAPTGSWEFASDARLRDESFALPVYWLCLGKLPLTFMPEILGMNLAMELSGVGDGYREARRFLKAHGFSTQFVDLHNTIDNVATGHSAWAADAIDRYMTGLLPLRDKALLDAHWLRVGTGYASLSCAPAPRGVPLLSRLGARLAGASSKPQQPARPLHHFSHPMETV